MREESHIPNETGLTIVVGGQYHVEDDILPPYPRRLDIRSHGTPQRIPRQIVIVLAGLPAKRSLIQTLRVGFRLRIGLSGGRPLRHLVGLKVARSRTGEITVGLHV